MSASSLGLNESMMALFEDKVVKEALAYIEKIHEETTAEQIELTEIEAPTFCEASRGLVYKEKLEKLGIENVSVDEVGNVFGVRKGKGNGPTLVLCAHLDTVFPAGTDLKATWKDGKVYAPGIADDGRGLAVVLAIAKTLKETQIETEGDLVIGATVGEEGLGDLRGVKHLFDSRDDIDGFISIEPGEPERITYLGTGSKRYEVTYAGPGGHSFGSFGTPSPIHALGRAIGEISNLMTPEHPKTTYNIGMISGGTSINTIAQSATMLVDMRSNSQEELQRLEAEVLALFQKSAKEENAFRSKTDEITVTVKLVGDRPAGNQPDEAEIVQVACEATRVLGFEPILDDASSTDSNVPIHLGIPAVTLGGGGKAGGFHTLQEYYDPTNGFLGVQKVLLTVLALLGCPGVAKPALKKTAKAVTLNGSN